MQATERLSYLQPLFQLNLQERFQLIKIYFILKNNSTTSVTGS